MIYFIKKNKKNHDFIKKRSIKNLKNHDFYLHWPHSMARCDLQIMRYDLPTRPAEKTIFTSPNISLFLYLPLPCSKQGSK